MKRVQQFLSAALLLSVAACGGGGGSTAGGAIPNTTPTGGVTLPSSTKVGSATAMATVSTGLPLIKSALRRASSIGTKSAYNISSVEVDGTMVPGYASSVSVTNKVILTPSNGTVTINIPFSNVPVGNNEWMVLSLYGIAPDGSKFDLGQLASLVNVADGQVTPVNLNAASTQTFEVFSSLLAQYVFSSVDLQNASLATTIGTAIANSGVTPDAATQLFTPQQLSTIDTAIAPNYAHTLTVTTNAPLANPFYLAISDYTNVPERNLQYNRQGLYGLPNASVNLGPGSLRPCWVMQVEPAGPGSVPPPGAAGSCSTERLAGPSMTLQSVYGGPVKVGVTTTIPPYSGAWTSLASLTPGQNQVTLTPASQDLQATLNDPQGWAFPNFYGCAPSASCSLRNYTTPGFLNPFSQYQMPMTSYPVRLPASGYGPSNNVVDIRTAGFIGEPASGLQLCSNDNLDNSCTQVSAITAGTPVDVHRSFVDSGENFSYFNWKGSTGVTAGQGYSPCWLSSGTARFGTAIATGGAPTGSISTSTPAYLGAQGAHTSIVINGIPVHDTSGCTSGIPNGASYSQGTGTTATWTVTVTDVNGTTYTGTATGSGYISVNMPTITKTIQTKSISIGWSVPSGTTPPSGWGVYRIQSQMNNGANL